MTEVRVQTTDGMASWKNFRCIIELSPDLRTLSSLKLSSLVYGGEYIFYFGKWFIESSPQFCKFLDILREIRIRCCNTKTLQRTHVEKGTSRVFGRAAASTTRCWAAGMIRKIGEALDRERLPPTSIIVITFQIVRAYFSFGEDGAVSDLQ